MITRRRISLAGGFSLITSSSLGVGQTGRPLRRVGSLTASLEALAAPFLAALKHGMRELGWQEGTSVQCRFVHANGAAIINLETMRALGIPVPHSILLRATESIQ